MSRSIALRKLAPIAAFVLGFASLARASTWTVGPAGDFSTIQAAIDGAAPGDVIVVANGSWSGFTLTKGLSIFGSGGTSVSGEITIAGVTSGPRVQVAGLSSLALSVLDCSRVVVLDDVTVANTPTFSSRVARIERCGDVRVLRSTFTSTVRTLHGDVPVPALGVTDARVELSRCSITGRTGVEGATGNGAGGPGGNAIRLAAGADVHVALSQIRGGDGGADSDCPDANCDAIAGAGGHALHVVGPGARVFVTGRAEDICRGGNGGLITNYAGHGSPGFGGNGLRVEGANSARVSGATFAGGTFGLPSGGAFPSISSASSSTLVRPMPADPSLELQGSAHAPGDVVTFAVYAQPGSSVRLRLGRQPIVEDLPLSAEDRLVESLRAYNLGVVPPSGAVFTTVLLRENAPGGALFVHQAAVVQTNGTTEMSQSWPAILR